MKPSSLALPTAASWGSHDRETEFAARRGFLVESAVGGMDRKTHVVFVQYFGSLALAVCDITSQSV